ncbi:hypothetical protein AKJ66_04455 [candidate division MSBL1 archaeon SCGC-AAA259E22]|uniref:Uncharacterized protein n=1 Tax=candidate division MSBL1 archaeon SCGC-AAA259E22 TaxID=1698265 RepID=A0A133UDH8_9EURY|nr:hypothetical protein AKJ66_04455 [candidate division MSBL1 archaeon SCGC-AAA259E22]
MSEEEVSEIFRCEDVPKEAIIAKINRTIEKLESGKTVKVPNVHHRNAEFNGARWTMPKKYVKWSKNGDCGRRLLKLLKALRNPDCKSGVSSLIFSP